MQKICITLLALILFVNQPNCLSEELNNKQNDKVKVFTLEEKSKIRKFLNWVSLKIFKNIGFSNKFNLMCRLYKPGIVLDGNIFDNSSEPRTKLDQKFLTAYNYRLWGNGPYWWWPKCLPEQITIQLDSVYLDASVRRWSYVGNKTYYYKKTTPELMQAIANVKEGNIIEVLNYFFKEENSGGVKAYKAFCRWTTLTRYIV